MDFYGTDAHKKVCLNFINLFIKNNIIRCRLGVATLKGKIYVCGGYDGSTFLQSAEVYDPKTEKWNFIGIQYFILCHIFSTNLLK